MSAKPSTTVSSDGDGNERLPMFHRTIRVPASLWQAVKQRSADDGKAIVWPIRELGEVRFLRAPGGDVLNYLGAGGNLAMVDPSVPICQWPADRAGLLAMPMSARANGLLRLAPAKNGG